MFSYWKLLFAYVINCNRLFFVTQQKCNAVNERSKYHEENTEISNLVCVVIKGFAKYVVPQRLVKSLKLKKILFEIETICLNTNWKCNSEN